MEEEFEQDSYWSSVSFSEDIGILETRISKERGSTFSFASFSSIGRVTIADKRNFETILACRDCGQLKGYQTSCCKGGACSRHAEIWFLFSPVFSQKYTGPGRPTYRQVMGHDRKNLLAQGTVCGRAMHNRVPITLAKAIIQAIPKSEWMSKRSYYEKANLEKVQEISSRGKNDLKTSQDTSFRETSKGQWFGASITQWFVRIFGFHASEISKVYVFVR